MGLEPAQPHFVAQTDAGRLRASLGNIVIQYHRSYQQPFGDPPHHSGFKPAQNNGLYNDAMMRTTIMADEATIDKLRALAASRKVSLAEVVREALRDKAATYRPKPTSLGSGQSAPAATAASGASKRQPPRSWR